MNRARRPDRSSTSGRGRTSIARTSPNLHGEPLGPCGAPLVGASRALVVALALLCAALLWWHQGTRDALAASGGEGATVTYAEATLHHFQLDGRAAYCVDPDKASPVVGKRFEGWSSGSWALDYLLYHAEGGPGPHVANQGAALRVAYALGKRNSYYCHYTPDGIELPEQDAAFFQRVYDSCLNFESQGAKGPERGCSRVFSPADGSGQRLAQAATGCISLSKRSSKPSVTDASDRYSLGDAVYGIYRDPACTDEVVGARMTTDDNGQATSVQLGAAAPTTYYVREISPSEGFQTSDEVLVAQVSAGATASVTSIETPKTGEIRLKKDSRGKADVRMNAHYSLEGAVYGIYDAPSCAEEHLVTTFATDAQGYATAQDIVAGTYWILERTPSRGHALDPEKHQVEVVGGETSNVSSVEQQLYGWIDLSKASRHPGVSSFSNCYDLGGARYAIFADEACQQLVETLVLSRSSDGTQAYAKSGELVAGSYWVREVQAPNGYLPDDTSYAVTVRVNETTRVGGADQHVLETPAHSQNQALVAKLDAEGNAIAQEGPQGAATLAGAIFEVRYYDGYYDDVRSLPAAPRRTWRFGTDAQGLVLFDTGHLQGGDELFVDGDGHPALPLGTYAIREIAAPKGYWLEGQTGPAPSYVAPTHLSQVKRDERAELGAVTVDLNWDSSLALPHESLGARGVGDQVQRGGLSLRKVDRETTQGPQAGASLAGISFGIYNRNDNPVFCEGQAWGPGEEIECLRMVTDEEGCAATSADAIPIGTYEVAEIATNDSYLSGSEPQTITLSAVDANSVKALEQAFANDVVRGGVAVGKVDLQNGRHAPQGAGTFADVVLGVRLRAQDSQGRAQHAALVDGKTISPGALACTVTLDHEGFGQTAADALPYGSWELVEISLPKDCGYLPNSEWSRPFDVVEQGVVVDLSSEGDSVPNEVKRSDLRAVKAKESSQGRMKGIPFVLRSETTGEWHVLVSDDNGQLDTSSGWASRLAGNANANDAAVAQAPDGSFELRDPAKLDAEAGIWFSGSSELPIAPEDARRALPYDSYRLQELRVSEAQARVSGGSSNEGTQLVDLALRVYRHNAVVDLGTIDDQPLPSLATYLGYDGRLKGAPAAADLMLVDVVSYQDLSAGSDYELVGELHLVSPEGADDGVVSSAHRAFRADLSSGTIELPFELDASRLEGRSLVAFERLLQGGIEVARHADLTDAAQTVSVPSIATTLCDSDGSHEAPSCGPVVLIDTVHYRGLVPGEAYTLTGTLMDKESGEAIVVAGRELAARAVFVPQEPAGETEVRFEVNGPALAGRTVVAFESLSQEGRELAVHADLEDAAQTVSFPAIATTLVDQASGEHDAAAGPLVLLDTVNYANLVPGREYELVGTLMDKATGKPLDYGEGPVSAQARLVPDKPSGSCELRFELDASTLGGHELVAFESLHGEGREIAAHADLDDEGQTVRIPRISTSLGHAAEPDLAEGPADTELTLVDRVSYEGLIPGAEYLLTGTLHDKQSAQPVVIAGKPLQSQVRFVPDASSGSTEVSFVFDATSLAAKTVVAFESLERAGRELAVHADIRDEAQSYRFPRIRTTFANTDGDDELLAEGSVVLVDSVSYENLEPGQDYVLSGVLMDRASGEPLKGPDGEVRASAAFRPEEPSGTVALSFELDAQDLAGHDVVAFEHLGREGRTVCSHADLDDREQTVSFPKLATRLAEETSGLQVASPFGTVRLVDTVEYANLEPGREYRMVGTLMRKQDGTPLKDARGEAVASATSFVPEEREGSIEIAFEFEAKDLAGSELVAFEALSARGRTVAAHADLSDPAQTVVLPAPSIRTSLVEQQAGAHQAEPQPQTTLVDRVSYEGLVPGKEYELSGTLMDKATGKALLIDTNPVHASTTFVPTEAAGTVEVSFEFDASSCAGKTVVAFERLSLEGREVAAHADLDDREQAVSFSVTERMARPSGLPSMRDILVSALPIVGLGLAALAGGMGLRLTRLARHRRP